MTPKILIVDDNPELGQVIKLALRRLGVESHHVLSGPLALKWLGEQMPDLMVLDIGMPDMSGWEVLTAIKEQFPDSTFPVIMLTAFTDPANKIIGKLQSRVYKYMTKPFHPDTLADAVREAIHLPK